MEATANLSSAVIGGSFAPTYQFEKLEIHKVCLSFPNFNLGQNLSPLTLADKLPAALAECYHPAVGYTMPMLFFGSRCCASAFLFAEGE